MDIGAPRSCAIPPPTIAVGKSGMWKRPTAPRRSSGGRLAVILAAAGAPSYLAARMSPFQRPANADSIIERKLNIVLPFCYPTG